jgi:hypothetical protein
MGLNDHTTLGDSVTVGLTTKKKPVEEKEKKDEKGEDQSDTNEKKEDNI